MLHNKICYQSHTFYFHAFAFIFLESSTQTANKVDDAKRPRAFFVCLVGTNFNGLPEKENYLYDVATEMELQGFQVNFLSAKDIQEFYRKHHPDFNEAEVDIYEMTLFFVEMHKRSSFFFDEVPFIKGKCKSHSFLSE